MVQVEKEALALTWACERFRDFIIVLHFELETDHKPLVSLLGGQALDTLPPKIQRFRMGLMRYRYTITHVPGPHDCRHTLPGSAAVWWGDRA